MDTVIETEVRSQKRRKRIWFILSGIAVLVLAIVLLRSFITPTLNKSAIATAVVERGDIENTINASGEILPEFEEIISSPINASVQKVMLDAGAAIKTGQSILTLDKSSAQSMYEKQEFQLDSKRNDIRKLKLELDKSFFDIKSNNDVKQLRINSLEADVENAKRLFKAGGGTREDIEQAELNLKVARLEKLQLENEIRSKQQTMEVEMKEATIAAAIQESDLRDLARKLQLADITASRNGVVTWVNKNIGASIHEGDALARIADLSSFKVQGSIADSYLDQLHNGMSALIRINETMVRGEVVNIQPSIQNGIVTFNIQLNEQDNKLLRPNMKVDVFLVTASKNNVLRVANGPAFKGPPQQDVFIVRAGKAEKRQLTIGLSNFDYVELTGNIQPGDIIITSDMSAYKNTRELIINNSTK